MKKIFLALFLFVSLMIQAQTTYYIDPAGNNGNNGSIGSPWLTLTYACARVTTSGDIIHVNAGTYIETNKCTLANGVSIEGAGVSSIIKSHYVAGKSNRNDSFIMVTGGSAAQHISGIYLDGDNLAGDNAIAITKSNVSVYNCTVINFAQQGIRFGGSVNATGNSIYNSSILNCSANEGYNYRTEAILLGYQTGFLFYNNTVNNNLRAANGVGLKVGKSVYGLKIYDNNFTGPRICNGPGYPFTIECWASDKQTGNGMELYGNTFRGQVDFSSSFKGSYSFGVSVHNNTFGYEVTDIPTSSSAAGALCLQFEETMNDIQIYNNLFKNTDRNIYFCSNGTSGSINNVHIYNNIFQNIHYSPTPAQRTSAGYSGHGVGIIFGGGHAFTGAVTGVYIWNNAFIAYSGGPGPAELGIFLPATNTCSNINVQNNIFQGFRIAPLSAEAQSGGGSLTTLVIQKNIYYNNATNNLVTVGFTPTNVTNDNGIIENPDFVSSTDFHLKTSSPAIGRGIYVGLISDKDGVAWKNPPSIGAYEYIGEDNPPSIMNQSFQITENSSNGTVTGTVEAYDPDAGQTLTFSIQSGNTDDAFTINASTGVLSVANGAALNADFALVVKVQDNSTGELSSQAIITINIIPVEIEITGNNSTIKVYHNPVSDELTQVAN